MRSPTTTGEEWPGGTFTFQRTLVSGPISAGSLAAPSARPVQLGPRNWGQSAAWTGRERRAVNSRAAVTGCGFVSMNLLAGGAGVGPTMGVILPLPTGARKGKTAAVRKPATR